MQNPCKIHGKSQKVLILHPLIAVSVLAELLALGAFVLAAAVYLLPPPWVKRTLSKVDDLTARLPGKLDAAFAGEALRAALPPEAIQAMLHTELEYLVKEGGPAQEIAELAAETAGRVIAEQAVGMLASIKKPEVANALRERGLATRRSLPLAGGIGKLATDAGLMDGLGGLASLLPPEAMQGLIASFLQGMGQQGGNGGQLGARQPPQLQGGSPF